MDANAKRRRFAPKPATEKTGLANRVRGKISVRERRFSREVVSRLKARDIILVECYVCSNFRPWFRQRGTRAFCAWVAAGRATVLIKLLSRKSLLDWQGLVLAAPRAPAQRLPPQRQK